MSVSSKFEDNVAVQYWMDSLNGKIEPRTTKYNWMLQIKRFCKWIGKSPDELIAERKEQLKSDDERVRHQAEMNLKRFLNYLEGEGLSENTKRNYFTCVRNFYKRNYVGLEFFRGDSPGNQTVSKGCRAANKADIRKMLEVSSPRVRALILFFKDTGLAEVDVAPLKLKDLDVKTVADIFNLEAPIPIILTRKKTKKTGGKTITFLGQESLHALKNTLRMRQRGNPEIYIRKKGKRKIIVPERLTLDSPIFRSYAKLYAVRNGEEGVGGHLTPNALSIIVRKAAVLADVWSRGFSAHALRRFFQTSLEISGMNPNWIKKMMGHTLGGSEAPYSRPEIEVLKSAYAKAYPYLAISEQIEQRGRVEALESQVEALVLNGKQKDIRIKELETLNLEDQMAEMQKELKTSRKLLDDVEKYAREKIMELESELHTYREWDMQDQEREMREEYSKDHEAFMKKYGLTKKEEEKLQKETWEYQKRQPTFWELRKSGAIKLLPYLEKLAKEWAKKEKSKEKKKRDR